MLNASGIEDAKTYHGNSSLQWRIAIELIDSIPLMESERILDIGSGDGKVTALLAEKTSKGSVLGIDISQSMIDFASSHYPQTNYPNLAFQQRDAAELCFENQFDRVVSFSTLHWVLDQEKVLKAIYRALVPGGAVSIHTYGKSPMNVTSVGEALVHTEKWATYFPSYSKQRVFFTEQEYQALLEQAGFQQVRVVGSWDDTLFPNRQALIDFAKPLLNFIRHLPQDMQQAFVEEVTDTIISIANSSKEEPIYYRTFSLRAQGYK
ncbi:MAG: methyltransferase domain-containing protein [Rhabdochlamydiaceae bacterium]